ncbi:uncharacterized protein LOC110050238 [Orbicella faveolata]|uniref:uncharacterized protein LOC110050238 n=1 Tax=Orbicella faveolata TaxID=48498 RepID=UPI0009E1C940|nr:uncharacterized protein LOC110050238 [Orbicella faveolata]
MASKNGEPYSRKPKGVVAFKEGQPGNLELNNLAGRICKQWTTIGLHLGISQDVLDGIDVNERNDRPYQMLLRWIRTTDSDAPYRDLYHALCEEKVGLDKVAREFCCKETTGVEMTAAEAQKTPSRRVKENVNNYKVKQGSPSNSKLEELGSDIHAEGNSWKRLARRLEIEEPKITAIDDKEDELSEKAYKMLLHWKQVNGSGATYKVLFEALHNKMVDRTDLAIKYCCES